VFEPRALVVHAALLGTTALLASAYPMWLVARLPIAATLRNEVVG
jgi:ABC-type lipoprotein release transport system permease subunit